MFDTLLDAALDSVKVIPLLLIVYFIIEYFEHQRQDVFLKVIVGSKRIGPVYGALFGCIPQCGFSAVMSDLYARRYITIGTLIAVYLSTSDEALPILLAHPDQLPTVGLLLAIKLFFGVLFGFGVDFFLRGRKKAVETPAESENHSAHCHCGGGTIFLEALRHTMTIFVYVLIANIVLNTIIHFASEETIASFLMLGTVFQPFIAALVGLIPNCAASVILVQLYLTGSLSFASMLAGLSAGAGVGMLVLFKSNKNLRENFSVVTLVYLLSVAAGFLTGLVIR